MPRARRLQPAAEWTELASTAADWKAADPALLATMLGQLHLIRAFEETVLELAGEGLVHGPAHSSIGQEGGAVGSIAGLRSADGVNGSHRGHHQFLAKALTHVTKGTLDLAHLVTPEVAEVLQRTLAEILGLAQGYCAGRGGSMHLQWLEAGALGTNAIVGGGVPMAAGNAWAQKHAGTTDLTVTYFGDGAVNIGSVLETMNLAAAWQLPLAFFIENNGYAVSTTVQEATGEPRLSARGTGFGIPSYRVDGMDPLAVHLAMEAAARRMRSGEGPVVIEALVYRFFHQNGPFPGSAFGYRTREEEAAWRARDPLDRVAAEMSRLGLIGEAGIQAIRDQAQEAMREAAGQLVDRDPAEGGPAGGAAAKPGTRRIRPGLWPDPAFVDVGIRGDAGEIAGARTAEEASFPGELRRGKFIDAVWRVMDRRMTADDRIVVLGEDVHKLSGGTNGATRGLAGKFPGRVLGTPISENAFAGLGGGMALDGRFRPVVEFMYPDFLWVAADQVFNQVGKARHMFGGKNPVPLVLRTKIALGTGYGSQHLMDPAGIFATSPGWRVMAPATPFDYIGMMNAALALEDPVLVIEHVDLYGSQGDIPVDDLDYLIPFGTAAVRRPGRDVTVLAYLSMVEEARAAIEATGIDAELIDLRFLDRASLDWQTVGASVRKTNAVLIVEQGSLGTSYGGWLADEVQRRFFDWLDQPVQRVTGSEASPSISRVLERAAIARADAVAAGLERVRRGFGDTASGGTGPGAGGRDGSAR
jgi:2-oxoisovalerate dehydrogenase E1 component